MALEITGRYTIYLFFFVAGLVLHEENIALLSDSFLNVKSKLEQNASSLVSAELKLTGNTLDHEGVHTGMYYCVYIPVTV